MGLRFDLRGMSNSNGKDHDDVLSSMRSGLELAGFGVDGVEYDAEECAILVRYVLTREATASVTDEATATQVLDEHVPRIAGVFDSMIEDAREPDRYRRVVAFALDPPETSASDERYTLRVAIDAEVARELHRRETSDDLGALYRRVADTAVLIDADGEAEELHLQLDID